MHVGTSGKAKLTVGAALRADDDKSNICDGDEDDEGGGFDDKYNPLSWVNDLCTRTL